MSKFSAASSQYTAASSQYTASTAQSASTRATDNQPSTSEVLLAKKQLKMEAMIRRLLVQQQEADATIQELSHSLSRLEPLDCEDTAYAEAQQPQKQYGGIGQHVMPPQHRKSFHMQPESQVMSSLMAPVSSRSQSSCSSRHTASHNVQSLISPAQLFQQQQKKRHAITNSPNVNPSNIKPANEPYIAPVVPQHLASHEIDSNVFNWGGTGERKAWEASSDRWATSGDVHARKSCKVRARPATCTSRSTVSTIKEARPRSKVDQFQLEGLGKDAYKQLATQNSEMYGKHKHDSEIIAGGGR